MTKLVSTWEELSELPPSKTHYLEITTEDGNGWIHVIGDWGSMEYLSTHTFYGTMYESSTETLQACGFDVQLKNWDETK